MPYASDKQRRFMHARHPGIASEWDEEIREGKSKKRKLSEVGKRMSREDRQKAAATGAGAVGVGAGLLGGGIPGTRATRLTADVLSAPHHRKPVELVRARQAGAFGLRHTGHKILHDVVLEPKHAAQTGNSSSSRFLRGLYGGKAESERKIIGHLRRGKIASNVVLASGVGALAYGMSGRKKPVEKAQRDPERLDTALVGAGGTLAAGSYGGGRLLRSQAHKWSAQSRAALNEAGRIVPEAGAHTVGRRYGVPVVKPTMSNVEITPKVLRGTSKKQIEHLGHLRGTAGQSKYFANVYGAFGMGLRRGVAPVGLATAAVGGKRIRDRSKREQLARGPVMKAEWVGVGKANRGTNLKDYDYLPENIREDVGYGSIRTRRNPMSALDLFASSRVMAESAARASGERIRGRRLSRRAHNEMNYAGSRAMIYSPVGRGSVF